MTAPAPSAHGTLAQTPLLHLLVYALDRRLTGTLVLEDPAQKKHALLFESGVPVKARAHQPVRRLGELVLELGMAAPAAVTQAIEQAKSERRLLGDVLLSSGALDEMGLRQALIEQVCRTVLALAGLPGETAFGYYDALNYLQRWGGASGAEVGPLSLIWRVARQHAQPQQVDAVLSRLGQAPLRLHIDAPVGRFGFEPRVQAVVDVLRAKPQPLTELLARDLVEVDTARRLLCTLALLRHLELPGAALPIGMDVRAPIRTTPTRPPSVTPPQAVRVTPATAQRSGMLRAERVTPAAPKATNGPEIQAMREQIRKRAGDTTASYYEVLGVPADAPVSVIQGAFFQLAKLWHPDRLGSEFDDLRELATRMFARMSEAHQVLCDADKRREYDELVARSGADAEEQAQVQRVLRAATAYQKALIFLKRSNLEGAEQEARKALEDDPEQADYIALVAWIDAAKPNAEIEPLIGDLDRAVKMEENNLRVRWYRGQLLKRLGREARAMADFRHILDRDPKHVDAQREVRLFEMRRSAPKASRSEPSPGANDAPQAKDRPSAGVFGRFFKKP